MHLSLSFSLVEAGGGGRLLVGKLGTGDFAACLGPCHGGNEGPDPRGIWGHFASLREVTDKCMKKRKIMLVAL